MKFWVVFYEGLPQGERPIYPGVLRDHDPDFVTGVLPLYQSIEEAVAAVKDNMRLREVHGFSQDRTLDRYTYSPAEIKLRGYPASAWDHRIGIAP